MESFRRWSALLAASLIGAACTAPHGIFWHDPGAGGSAGDSEAPPVFAPPSPTLRRLLARQYRAAVRDLLGDAAAAVAAPPPDSSLTGFDAIGAAQLAVGDTAVTEYESSALAVATAASSDPAVIGGYLDCTPAGPSDIACQRSFVARFGRAAWRRPLDAEDIDRYASIAAEAAGDLNDFYAGVRYVIAAFLQSPGFLYQVEIGAPDPADASIRRLSGYEVATRMSFFLLGTTPSATLLDAAEAGALDTAEGVRSAARDLLAKPEARAALDAFYGELFSLRDLDSLAKDTTVYPQFGPALAQAMGEETRRLIADVVWDRNADYREIFDAGHTFVNADLAALYGVAAPGAGFAKVTLPAAQKRRGFLGHAGFNALFAHASTTSPTLRGKFVRERLLCQAIPAPPGNVAQNLPSDAEAKTMRDKLLVHMKDPACNGCHAMMDPIGFALESYDAIGAFRTKDNGVTIDTSADVDDIGAFDGADTLGGLLRDRSDVGACVVRNLFRAATGHAETAGERGKIEALAASFATAGYRLQDLLVELVASDAFRMVGPIQGGG